MTSMDCKNCLHSLPDLLLDPAAASQEATDHLAACADCRQQLHDLRATMAVMDGWVAPEPSPYFDTRLYARLREARTTPPETLWERLSDFLHNRAGRGMRPALAGALGLAMLLGGGTAATLLLHHAPVATSSPAVNDLRIYDNNAQAVQQMDLLDDAAPQS